MSEKLSHWYKIQIELKTGEEWKVIHEVEFKWDDFNDNFKRFIDKQLEGLYGVDRMVIYYDTERNLKEMKKIDGNKILGEY